MAKYRDFRNHILLPTYEFQDFSTFRGLYDWTATGTVKTVEKATKKNNGIPVAFNTFAA